MTEAHPTVGGDSSGGEPSMVTGLFGDTASLERAYQAVVLRGYGTGDINVAMSEETRKRYFPDDQIIRGTKASEVGELGGPIGGTIGTLLPVLVAVGAFLVFPPLGLVVAGPVTAALAGAGAAGLTAGLIGLFGKWGIPEERVQGYEAGIRKGGILMAVKPRTEEDARHFEQQWKEVGGEFVHS